MRFPKVGCWVNTLGTLCAIATSISASPLGHVPHTPLDLTAFHGPDADFLVQEGIRLAQSRGLEKRLETDFSLDHEWHNEVLFGGSWTDATVDSAQGVSLEVTCIDCYTRGLVTVELWEDLIDPTLKLGFTGVEAYVFLGVEVTAGQTFTINLFSSDSPIGLSFPGLNVGVVFFVDLVFSLSEEIDLTGGFHVTLADDAYLEADIFGGDIVDSFFDGMSSKSLPVTVTAGRATFKADLRLRVQAGAETELDMIGIGAGAVVGVYANIVEFVALVEYTPECPLQTEMWWNLNVGAYAELNVVVDYTTIGPVPTVSTTLLTAPTLTHCWIEGGSGGTSSGVPPPIAITSTATTTTPSSPTPVIPAPEDPYSSATEFPTSLVCYNDTVCASTSSIQPSQSFSSSPTSISWTSFIATPSPTSSPPLSPSFTPSPTSVTTSADEEEYTTSTVCATSTYTLTRCAAPDAINCPASYQSEVVVTRTVPVLTTVCPVTASITAPSSSSSSSQSTISTTAATADDGHPTPTANIIVEETVTLTRCPTPIKNTFVAPPPPSAIPTTTTSTTPTTDQPNEEEGEEEEEEEGEQGQGDAVNNPLLPNLVPTTVTTAAVVPLPPPTTGTTTTTTTPHIPGVAAPTGSGGIVMPGHATAAASSSSPIPVGGGAPSLRRPASASALGLAVALVAACVLAGVM